MDNRIPLSWAIARGRDALLRNNNFSSMKDIQEDKEAAIALTKWLDREWERTKSKRKQHDNE